MSFGSLSAIGSVDYSKQKTENTGVLASAKPETENTGVVANLFDGKHVNKKQEELFAPPTENTGVVAFKGTENTGVAGASAGSLNIAA